MAEITRMLAANICRQFFFVIKGGFPVMAETTRSHIFSKEISQVIIAAMVLAPNFY